MTDRKEVAQEIVAWMRQAAKADHRHDALIDGVERRFGGSNTSEIERLQGRIVELESEVTYLRSEIHYLVEGPIDD